MGTDPKTSALNRYLQSWDVPNLFVMGASAFPQNAGYNPTGTVARAGLLGGHGDPQSISEEPGTAGRCVSEPPSIVLGAAARAGARSWRCHRSRRDSPTARISRRSRRAAISPPPPIASACHTVPDSGKPFAGGRAIETPFGNIIAPNITPDRETGIGAWTDDQFDNARPPRHPSERLAALSGDAVHRLHQDVARRRAGDPRLSQHGRAGAAIRSSPTRCRFRSTSAPRCGSGTALYFTAGEFKPDPQKSAEWNRGAFLVEGPAIAAPAIRRSRFWAATRPANICAARICRAGSRPTSPMMPAPVLARWSVG